MLVMAPRRSGSIWSCDKVYSAAAHGVADVATFFLWELAGTPLEQSNNGRRMLVQVSYDAEKRVDQVVYLKAE